LLAKGQIIGDDIPWGNSSIAPTTLGEYYKNMEMPKYLII